MSNRRSGRNSILALTLSVAMALSNFTAVYAQETNAENDVFEMMAEDSVVSEDGIVLQECVDDSINDETINVLDGEELTEDVILTEEISESEDELCLDDDEEEITVDAETTDSENEDAEEVNDIDILETDEEMELSSITIDHVKKNKAPSEVSFSNLSEYICDLTRPNTMSTEYISLQETIEVKGAGRENGKVKVAIVKTGEEPTFTNNDDFYAEFVDDGVDPYTKKCDCLTPGEKYDAWFYQPETESIEAGYLKITFTVKNHEPEMQSEEIKYYSNCVMHWKHCIECGDNFDYEAHYDLDNNGKCDVCGMTYYDNALYILSSESEIPDAAPAQLGDYEYTGKQVCPEVFVYCGGHLLKQGRDYKLKYANNVKVCDFDATAKDKNGNDVEVGPSVTATGAGNYKGSCTIRFSIVKADITHVDIADYVAKYANGNNVNIAPAVKLGKTTLVAGKDYEFYNESSTEWVKSYRYSLADGSHTVKIRGINNYQGETSFRFEIIRELKSISSLKIDAIPNQNYTGEEITDLSLYSNKVSLDNILGADNYKVTYENNIEPGKAVAIVSIKEGKAADAGYSEMGSKRINFNIIENNLKDASLTFNNVVYTGVPVSLQYGDVKFKKADGSIIDLWNSDFTAEWTDNINKGTAKVKLTGKGIYKGTKTFSVKIEPLDATTSSNINMNYAGKADYDVKGAYWEPEIGHKISSGKYKLVKGKDYTLSYKNVKAVADENSAKAPSVTIKFIGNYKGTKTIKYEIEPSMYSTDSVMRVKDIYAKYTGKPIAVKPVVRFKGTTLKQGIDYDVVLAEDTNKLAKASYTDVGVHKFKIKLKGNYKGLSNEFEFKITSQDTNLFGSFKVAKIPDQSYTGNRIEIDDMKLFSGKDPEGKKL